MPSTIYNETWAKTWAVPAETAPQIAEQMHRGLYHTFNSPRTIRSTGTIRIFPDHLQRPGSLGMHLLQSMQTDLTPLPKELQFLISSTACQHRIQFVPAEGDTISRLVYYDGRFMYAGCCQGLGVAGGKYRHTEGEDIREDERGRARVRFGVPDDWQHHGLLPVKDEAGAWCWPSAWGTYWETWADLCEIRFARSMGWHVEVLEKITWPEDRPLDLWAQRLTRLYLKAHEEENAHLARCYRSICLHTIGRFHNLGFRDERVVVQADDPRATFDSIERVDGEGVHIRDRVSVNKPERECHPEWSAAVWSKVHLRVAKALMSVPRETILAVRGDAIYMTDHPDIQGDEPNSWAWYDEGKCGQFRDKGTWDGPLPAPRHWADLKKLTDA